MKRPPLFALCAPLSSPTFCLQLLRVARLEAEAASPIANVASPTTPMSSSSITLVSALSSPSDEETPFPDSPNSRTVLVVVRPADGPLGITVLPLATEGDVCEGLIVAGVVGTTGSGSPKKNSPKRSVFQVGDVILGVGGVAVGRMEFDKALQVRKREGSALHGAIVACFESVVLSGAFTQRAAQIRCSPCAIWVAPIASFAHIERDSCCRCWGGSTGRCSFVGGSGRV